MTNLFGEFFGTLLLLAFGCSTVANVALKESKANGGGWIVITAGWAFGAFWGVSAAIALGAPQADLNPAITFFKMMIGVYSVPHALATMVAETLGGIAGAACCWLLFLPHWEVTEDKATKLGIFCTGPAIRNFKANLLCEIIATFFFITIVMILFSKALSNGGTAFTAGVGPYFVGVLIWSLGLSFGGPTGYAMNPARDLGPRIAHAILPIAGKGDSDWSYSWVPIVGPILGASLSLLFCKAVGLA